MKRHKDALDIQHGAVNPQAVAQAIVDACKEIRAQEGFTGTAQLTGDPAIKLMVHHLAHMTEIGDHWSLQEYHNAMTECEMAPWEEWANELKDDPNAKDKIRAFLATNLLPTIVA